MHALFVMISYKWDLEICTRASHLLALFDVVNGNMGFLVVWTHVYVCVVSYVIINVHDK